MQFSHIHALALRAARGRHPALVHEVKEASEEDEEAMRHSNDDQAYSRNTSHVFLSTNCQFALRGR